MKILFWILAILHIYCLGVNGIKTITADKVDDRISKLIASLIFGCTLYFLYQYYLLAWC